MQVAVGVDSHKSSFSVSVVDELGRELGVRVFSNHARGFAAAHQWIRSFGECTIGIEGSGRYGRPLAVFLERAGEIVHEVPASLTFRERNRRRSRGKSDPVDAVAIARVVARGEGLAPIRHNDVCGDLKALSDYRDQLIHTRTELANQTHHDLVGIAPGYEARIRNLVSKKNLAAAMTVVRGDPSVRRVGPSPHRTPPPPRCRDRRNQRRHRGQAPGIRIDPDRDPRRWALCGGPHPRRGRGPAIDQVAGSLRHPQRHRSARGVVGHGCAPSRQPRREPAAESSPPRGRFHPGSLMPRGEALHGTQTGRGQVISGGSAMPEAKPCQRHLPSTDGRPSGSGSGRLTT